ncbi:class I SAM-dependent methyltransferase [Plebeiibacterium sediminum]|uniref:Class I SAM-dependent methyltransferase n=1 Tax=Plebeiibacterium sediminum TaxID=2992112 RepID=A0AAE3M8R6_9BACT|nr:class I SAM-dependent methyltransferase [Plebeiobacterium sediminum]MCW3789052.1 class I SAM-dependent methyltransferase [Plebeiobacterium sediminum]
MSFYKDIVNAYDEIFPLNIKQLSFVEDLYASLGGKKMLDAGCGTGSLAIALGRRSASVKAFDLDGEMIKKAKEKCPQAINVKFKEGDLLLIGDVYKHGAFDLVYCFGNTVAHLNDLDEVKVFCEAAKSLLKPNGKLLLQTVNYDWVLNNDVKSLPTIESDHYIFERVYRYIETSSKIEFTTNLISKIEGAKQTQKVILFPIVKKQLEDILKQSFTDVKFYASFNRDEWNKDSFHTVIEATL